MFYLPISVKSFFDGEVVVKACWVAEYCLEEVWNDSSSDESVMNLRLANLDLVWDAIGYQLIALMLYNKDTERWKCDKSKMKLARIT